MLQKVKDELQRMENNSVIEQVTRLTDWCVPMVPVLKNTISGFWRTPLHPDSCKLTLLITPFGRYCFRWLPFGIFSTPEIFKRKMMETLQGLEGVEVLMNDIFIYGDLMELHNSMNTE